MKSSITLFNIILGLSAPALLYALPKVYPLENYCLEKGGQLIQMQAQNHALRAQAEPFCMFERDQGILVIGLAAFASSKPSIAATYMKALPPIEENSPLMKQENMGNPSYAVCMHLGGVAMNYKPVENVKNSGDTDICIFDDGSMVSGWTLIYMANHREGYDEIKGYVRAEPLDMKVP